MTIAFVFPGQGSQSVGMLNGFFAPRGESSPVTATDLKIENAVQAVLTEADAALALEILESAAGFWKRKQRTLVVLLDDGCCVRRVLPAFVL